MQYDVQSLLKLDKLKKKYVARYDNVHTELITQADLNNNFPQTVL